MLKICHHDEGRIPAKNKEVLIPPAIIAIKCNTKEEVCIEAQIPRADWENGGHSRDKQHTKIWLKKISPLWPLRLAFNAGPTVCILL